MLWSEFKSMVKENCFTDGTDPFAGAVAFRENYTKTGLRIAQQYLEFFRENNELSLSTAELSEEAGLARVELALTRIKDLEYARHIGYALVLDIDHGSSVHVKDGVSVNGQWFLEEGGTVRDGPWVRGPFRLKVVDGHPVTGDAGTWYVIEDDEDAVVYVSDSEVVPYSMVVEGAGATTANTIYLWDGESQGKPKFTTDSDTFSIHWSGSFPNYSWFFIDINSGGAVLYSSDEDVPTPDLVTMWDISFNGTPPPPTVRRGVLSDFAFGIDGDPGYSSLDRVSVFDYYDGEPEVVTSNLATTHSVTGLFQRRPMRRLPWSKRERLAANEVIKAGGYDDACNILGKGKLPFCYAYVREPGTDRYILSPYPKEEDRIVVRYSGIKTDWADGDEVPYGGELAYAVSQFVLSRILVVQHGKRTAANDLYAEFLNEISRIRREHRE